MADDLVMRSLYLGVKEDSDLRQLAHELRVSKSELMRSAISAKLEAWLAANSAELIMEDLEQIRQKRASVSQHGRVGTPKSKKDVYPG